MMPRIHHPGPPFTLVYEATGQSEKAVEWNKRLGEFDEAEKKTAARKLQPNQDAAK